MSDAQSGKVMDFAAEKRRREAEQLAALTAPDPDDDAPRTRPLRRARRLTTAAASRRFEPHVADRWSPRRTAVFVISVCTAFWLLVAAAVFTPFST